MATKTFDPRLDQGDTWTDAKGFAHSLRTMPIEYLRNVRFFLQLRAEKMYVNECLKLCSGIDARVFGADDEIERLAVRSGMAWLKDTRLFEALENEIARRESKASRDRARRKVVSKSVTRKTTRRPVRKNV